MTSDWNGPPAFVVHTDREAINRLHGRLVGIHAILMLILVAVLFVGAGLLAAIDIGGPLALMLLPFVILILGQAFQLAIHCYTWGARVAIAEPLFLSQQGFRMQTAVGTIEVPWDAVQSVRSLNKVMQINLHPGVTPESPGVRTDVSSRNWARLKRKGLMVGAKGLREDFKQIRQAIAHLSEGRVPVQ